MIDIFAANFRDVSAILSTWSLNAGLQTTCECQWNVGD
jgi:hypothetical protein